MALALVEREDAWHASKERDRDEWLALRQAVVSSTPSMVESLFPQFFSPKDTDEPPAAPVESVNAQDLDTLMAEAMQGEVFLSDIPTESEWL